MGSRLWLEMTEAEIDALRVAPFRATILKALAKYGAYFGDTGSSFWFNWQTEAGTQYTDVGAADRWLQFATANGWTWYDPDKTWVGSWDLNADGIDWMSKVWSRLRVIDPCVTEGNCR